MVEINKTRNLPGWKFAPVPICMGGDFRALAFCCHPHYDLTHSSVCQRKLTLNKIGLSEREYIQIKNDFSKRHKWDNPQTCFKSLSYCCMRRDGCPNTRDFVLYELYGDETTPWEVIQREYFSRKRLLGIELLKGAKNKVLVKQLLEFEEQNDGV
jgi:predicted metal-binding transcription factor (methanogenesis marker protein 9)